MYTAGLFVLPNYVGTPIYTDNLQRNISNIFTIFTVLILCSNTLVNRNIYNVFYLYIYFYCYLIFVIKIRGKIQCENIRYQ